MAGTPETLAGIPWGRVVAVAGAIVVVHALIRGGSRALGVAANEVMYRVGGAGPWVKPGQRA